MNNPEITQELVHKLFIYRGGSLYWRDARANNTIQPGTRAGYKLPGKNYRKVTIGHKNYFEHRLIFLYFNLKLKNIDRKLDALVSDNNQTNERRFKK